MFEPHLYAVFGYPIHHSKSPIVHRAFAEQTKQDLIYTKQEVKPEEFNEVCDEFFSLGGQGLNITLPLKELAFHYADQLTERAQLAQAVNTLKMLADNSILGDNTDGAGLVRDLVVSQGWSLRDKTILILGAGGAVRGVLGPLLGENPRKIIVANRTGEKAIELAKTFLSRGNIVGCGLNDIPVQPADIIINGTSMSLQGAVPSLPKALFTPATCVYDMAYASAPTAFLRWASQSGMTRTADGLGMLVEQAAESFYLWRQVRPETKPVMKLLRDK